MKHLNTFNNFINEARFTDYTNNELAAYVKNNPSDREAARELKKRSQNIKALTRTDESLDESLGDASEHLDAVQNALPELEKLINKYTKVKLKLKVKAVDARSGIVLRIYSDDIGAMLSPLGRTVFSKINIAFWGGNETRDGKIWFNPKISYEHPSGGSNGTDFIWDSLWFDPNTNKWIEGRRF